MKKWAIAIGYGVAIAAAAYALQPRFSEELPMSTLLLRSVTIGVFAAFATVRRDLFLFIAGLGIGVTAIVAWFGLLPQRDWFMAILYPIACVLPSVVAFFARRLTRRAH